MPFGSRLLVFLAIFGACHLPVPAQSGEDSPLGLMVETVDVDGGPEKNPAGVRYLLIRRPSSLPAGRAVILFAGGDGVLGIDQSGSILTSLAANFLVRKRFAFAHRGLTVAVVDAPGRQPLDGLTRTSKPYVTAMAKVVADIRKRTAAKKVWLVGTSSGTLSAMGVAARFPQVAGGHPEFNKTRPNGVVLTTTQTNPYDPAQGSLPAPTAARCHVTVFVKEPPSDPGAPMLIGNINVPIHVVSAADERCPCTSHPDRSQDVLNALTGTTIKDRVAFHGGDTQVADVCEALTPHGYLNIESGPVHDIVHWVKTH